MRYGIKGINENKGKVETKIKYDNMIYFYENEFAKVEVNGKYGLINSKGEQIIECVCDSITKCFDDEFLLKKDKTYYYYKLKENYMKKMEEEWIQNFESGYAILKSNEEFRVLTIDKSISYSEREKLDCNAFNKYREAWIEIDGKYGYINTNGDVLIECKYPSINEIDEEYTIVADESDRFGLINNRSLELVIECKYEFLSNLISIPKNYLIAIARDEETNYIIDRQGNIIKECNYIMMKCFDNNKYYITGNSKGKCGIVDEDFNIILDCKHDNILVDKNIICISDDGKKSMPKGTYYIGNNINTG